MPFVQCIFGAVRAKINEYQAAICGWHSAAAVQSRSFSAKGWYKLTERRKQRQRERERVWYIFIAFRTVQSTMSIRVQVHPSYCFRLKPSFCIGSMHRSTSVCYILLPRLRTYKQRETKLFSAQKWQEKTLHIDKYPRKMDEPSPWCPFFAFRDE